jgi:glycosyltransferase involved in cell wall biosynthesis
VLPQIGPHNTTFVLLSFEGPDVYSQAGGLGTRMAELGRALAQAGYATHLYFIGDPYRPGEEVLEDGRLVLHRWAQWISVYYPNGVYHGEVDKLNEYQKSVPPHVVNEIVAPNASQGRLTVVLAEEWHMVGTVLHLDHLLHWRWMRKHTVMYWNANNTYGFNLFDWGALRNAAVTTTVSKYMKHKMWAWGVNPLVIPNGIPSRLLSPVPKAQVDALRAVFAHNIFLAKIGRYDPDKRWLMAIEAVGVLRDIGMRPKIIVRGGMEPHRNDIYNLARHLGLTWQEIHLNHPDFDTILRTLHEASQFADIMELRFFVPEEFLRVLYAAADSVLANSGHEPFGLVGLEVMACGGIATTGSTGEDYAVPFNNAIVIDTEDSRELATYLIELQSNTALKEQMRQNGYRTAETFQWPFVIDGMVRKLQFTAMVEGAQWNA